ncbi:hypothetical protein ACFOLF_28890 [Paenibacillus sepulcri]|uniref:hypothetical protein n=1 Tax=Paenibacillus sepulcri TaxID=359917 RepID=UPI0035E75C77
MELPGRKGCPEPQGLPGRKGRLEQMGLPGRKVCLEQMELPGRKGCPEPQGLPGRKGRLELRFLLQLILFTQGISMIMLSLLLMVITTVLLPRFR